MRARRIAANEAVDAMDKYVPYLSGQLSKSASVSPEGDQIYYATKYARAQYYGKIGPFEKGKRNGKMYNIRHWTTATHPLAHSHWDMSMKANREDMKAIKDSFSKALNRYEK